MTTLQEQVFEIVDSPNGDIIGLKTRTLMLREDFDQTMETAEKILGGRPYPFPLDLSKGKWFLSTPNTFLLEENRVLVDAKSHLMGISPQWSESSGQKTFESMAGKNGILKNVHPKDHEKVIEINREVRNGASREVSYKVHKGGNRYRDSTCKCVPVDNPSGSEPNILMLHGDSQ